MIARSHTERNEPAISPRQAADHLWKLGANITAIPHGGKRPAHEWNNVHAPWATQRQPPHYVAKLNWATEAYLGQGGRLYPPIETVGVICGINGWRWFDVDAHKDAHGHKVPVPEAVRDTLLSALGLPDDYIWCGRSKSGMGWHIAIRCDENLPPELATAGTETKTTDGGGAGVKIGVPLDAWLAAFDHVELRWEGCQTTLPSPSGYTGQLPDVPPTLVGIEQVTNAFFAIAQLKPRRIATLPAASSPQPLHYDNPTRTHYVWDETTRTSIRNHFDLVAWFCQELGGETQIEPGGEIRLLGHMGLLINPEKQVWHIHGRGTGGDWADAIAHTRYGGVMPTGAGFYDLLKIAADFAHVELKTEPFIFQRQSEKLPKNGREPNTLDLSDRLRGLTINESGEIITDPEAATRALAWAQEAAHTTDLGNARRLCRLFSDQIRYIHTWGAWLIWDSTRWVKDETGEIHRLARETVRTIYAEAASTDDSATRKALARWATISESASKLGAMVDLARYEPGITVHHTELDADPWTLNCQNGTLDLRTGQLRPHNRADLITKRIDVPYIPHAPAPTWHHFLQRIMDGNTDMITFIQRAMGYTLTGNVGEQCLFFLHGSGANGKTTFIEAMADLLGCYWLKAPTEMLMVQRNGGGIPNDVAQLVGARMVVAAEVAEGRWLDEAKVKDLVGRDTLTARFMRQEFFRFRPVFKLWMYGNHKPRIRGTDNGIWRRIRLIPFTTMIPDAERDTNLPEKLRAELPGILAWVVEGCLAWQQTGLGTPEVVRHATEAYREEQDVLGAFLDDCCIVDRNAQVQATILYRAYVNWCEQNGERPLAQKQLGQRLDLRGFQNKRTKKGFYRLGLGVFSDQEGVSAGDPMNRGDPRISNSHEDQKRSGVTDSRITSDHRITPSEAQNPPFLPGCQLVRCDHTGVPTRYGIYWKVEGPHGEETDVDQHQSAVIAAAQRRWG